ncbi:hypothetical protein, partial [Xanthomonas fragariae]|uniref:hypothetical protein n=1 Tax=Xanthomonas fragariae TaxID=48664 RepID=UPI001F449CDA
GRTGAQVRHLASRLLWHALVGALGMRPTIAALCAPHFFAPLHDEKDGSLLDLVKLMRLRDIH